METPDQSLKSAGASRRFAHWAWAAILLSNLAVLVVVALAAVQNRQKAIADAMVVSDNYTRILEESFAGFIRNIDSMLLTVGDEIARQRSRGGIDDKMLDEFLAGQLAHVPEAVGLRVLDARGIVRHAIGEVRVQFADLSDRDHFIHHRDHAASGLLISDPRKGRVSDQWVVVFSRRIDNPDGSFAGEINIPVATSQLVSMLSKLDLGPSGSSSLWSRTVLIARHSRNDTESNRTGAAAPSPRLRELLDADAASGSYFAASIVDGVERRFHVRRVDGYSLYVVVGLAEVDYLADWRTDTRRLLLIAATFLSVTLLFGSLGHAAWRRRERTRMALVESERRLDLCIDAADLAMTDWDVANDRLVFGAGWKKLLGYDAAELQPQPGTLLHLVRGEDVAHARDALVAHLKGETPTIEAEVRMRHKEGHWLWVLARGRCVERSADGRAVRVTGVAMDITRRKEAEAEIARLSQWNELLLNSAGEGIYGVDLDGRVTFINPAAVGMLGYSRGEVVGRLQHELLHCQRDGTPCPEELCPVYATLKDGVRREAEDQFIRKNGESFPAQMTVTPIHEGGRLVGAEVMFQDIARRKAMEAELLRLATTDPLTGIANRRRLLEFMEAELARVKRFAEPSHLLMLDIDNFKLVNDTWGHAVGDAALRHFVDVCRLRVRQSDYFGRLGGEEFGIVLSRTDKSGALQFAEALRRSVAEAPVQTAKGPVPMTVSIGIAEFRIDDETPDGPLVRADVALYCAKDAGRNNVVINTLEDE